MKNFSRIAIYGLIALSVMTFLLLIEERPSIMPQGVFLPSTKTILAPQKVESVKLYKYMPTGATVVGVLNVMMRLTTVSEETKKQLWDYALQVAAENGATGIVEQYFFVATNDQMPMKNYMLRVQVIK